VPIQGIYPIQIASVGENILAISVKIPLYISMGTAGAASIFAMGPIREKVPK
jgi:hypothetical protein